MSEVNLGRTPTEDAVRDAVHVAVAPVRAYSELQPGQKVELRNGYACPVEGTAHGVVDPFRDGPVAGGDLFWLFMVPGSTSAPRHHWDHPAFAAPTDAQLEDPDPDGIGCGRTCD